MSGERLLDFGCGANPEHREAIESIGYRWKGLDVADSRDPLTGTELERLRRDPDVVLYAGGAIPIRDGSFDVVFSNQSLEHVPMIDLSISEIARLLKPGGCLVGSVSHLEPYHGFSTFNYTPYGFAMVCRRHGLRIERISAGIDAFTLILRVLVWKTAGHQPGKLIDQIFTSHYNSSPLNGFLDEVALLSVKGKEHDPAAMREAIRWANMLKLNFCGQFRFVVRKQP